jgi:serine/threonine-protein kinase RsbW
MPPSSEAVEQPHAVKSPPGHCPAMVWRQVFPGHKAQLGVVRRWLESLLPACGARDDVVSVTNELAGNAVLHSNSGRGGCFAVEVTWHALLVQVAVADSGAEAGPHVIDDPLMENGRGLRMVQELSVRTGVSGGRHGRVVWATLLWDGKSTPAPPGFPTTAYESAVRQSETDLAQKFPDALIWYGPRTFQWWALPRRGGICRLVAASSPEELAEQLVAIETDRRIPPAVVDAQRRSRGSSWHDQGGARMHSGLESGSQPTGAEFNNRPLNACATI